MHNLQMLTCAPSSGAHGVLGREGVECAEGWDDMWEGWRGPQVAHPTYSVHEWPLDGAGAVVEESAALC